MALWIKFINDVNSIDFRDAAVRNASSSPFFLSLFLFTFYFINILVSVHLQHVKFNFDFEWVGIHQSLSEIFFSEIFYLMLRVFQEKIKILQEISICLKHFKHLLILSLCRATSTSSYFKSLG